MTDPHEIPLHPASAGANRHDAPLLAPTLAGLRRLGSPPPDIAAHLDQGYHRAATRAQLAGLGCTPEIARRGVPAPIQAGKRRVVEHTQAWMNGSGKPRRRAEKAGWVVDFSLLLAAAHVVTRSPIRRARTRDRWPGRPTTRRLK